MMLQKSSSSQHGVLSADRPITNRATSWQQLHKNKCETILRQHQPHPPGLPKLPRPPPSQRCQPQSPPNDTPAVQ